MTIAIKTIDDASMGLLEFLNSTLLISSYLKQVQWPNFRGDKLHTGCTKNNGPLIKNAKIIFTAKDVITSSPAIDKYGSMYFGSADNSFYKIAYSGTLIWKYSTQGVIYSSPALSSMEDVVYFGSNDNYIYCLSSSTGSLVWRHLTGSPVSSSPYVYNYLVNQTILYIGSTDWYLYAINAVNGSFIRSYGTNAAIDYSSPVVFNETVYIGSTDGRTADKKRTKNFVLGSDQ